MGCYNIVAVDRGIVGQGRALSESATTFSSGWEY